MDRKTRTEKDLPENLFLEGTFRSVFDGNPSQAVLWVAAGLFVYSLIGVFMYSVTSMLMDHAPPALIGILLYGIGYNLGHSKGKKGTE